MSSDQNCIGIIARPKTTYTKITHSVNKHSDEKMVNEAQKMICKQLSVCLCVVCEEEGVRGGVSTEKVMIQAPTCHSQPCGTVARFQLAQSHVMSAV